MSIDEKNYKDWAIYFTRYFHSKLIKMLSPRYHELIGIMKENEGKKSLMVNGYVLHKALNKIKETINVIKFNGTKILIDDKLPDYITLKNVVILITYVTKDDAKLYPLKFLEEALYNDKTLKKDR